MPNFCGRPVHVLAFAIGLAATGGPAVAQQNTTATYGDWVLQCVNEEGPPPRKLCEIAQVTQVQGKNIPFSRVAVGALVKGQPVKLVVQLPVNILLRERVSIQLSDTDAAISAPFDHCLPTGCFAEFELKDDILKKFYESEGPGKVTFKDATGRDIAIPLSFKGLRSAYDALSKE
jgi:invasion protein IalB